MKPLTFIFFIGILNGVEKIKGGKFMDAFADKLGRIGAWVWSEQVS